MGFSSMDDFISEMTVSGKYVRNDWNKLTHAGSAAVAGEWACLFHSAGNPTNGVLTSGTNLSLQSLCSASTGAMYVGGPVAPDTKHVVTGSAGTASATATPSSAMLVDLLAFYPRNNLTVTGDVATLQATTFTADNTTDIITHAAYDIASFSRVRLTTTTTLPAGLSLATDYWTVRQSATTSKLAASFADAIAGTTIDFTTNGTGTHTVTVGLPRYTDGAGVQLFTTVTSVLGAGTPNMRVTYTNSAGVAGRLTPGTLPISKASAAVGLLDVSGSGAGKYGPFYPLAGSDAGVRSIEQTNLSATHTSGALAYVLARPLMSLPMAALGVITERDLMNQFPSLPQIQDGACLAWLLFNGAATPVNSSFYGHIDVAWG